MTRDLLAAVLAAALAAAGTVELLCVLGPRRPGRRRAPVLAAAAVGALRRLGRRAGAPSAPGGLPVRMAAAGSPLGMGTGDVMAVKGGAALVALLAAIPLGAVLPGRLPPVVAVALPLLAFFAPDAWLSQRIRARARAMEEELPDLLDLLRVGLEANLPLRRALAEAARRTPGALAVEVRRAVAELELGLPAEGVLERLAGRCPAAGLPALTGVLRRAGRHGAPPAEALAAQAREARAARARRVREDAARAAPKIQLVVALLLVPSVMLLVAAALVHSLL